MVSKMKFHTLLCTYYRNLTPLVLVCASAFFRFEFSNKLNNGSALINMGSHPVSVITCTDIKFRLGYCSVVLQNEITYVLKY